MPESQPGDVQAGLASLSDHARAIAERFVRAWEDGPEDGPPDIEAYVAEASADQQTLLRRLLSDIASTLLAAGDTSPGATIESTMLVHDTDIGRPVVQTATAAVVDSGATGEFSAPTADPESTGEFQVSGGSPEATGEFQVSAAGTQPDATVDLSRAAHDPGATVDPESADASGSDASLQFSWDPSGPTEEPAPKGEWPVVAGYQILGELGRGGMGVVYRARQRGLKRLVALKMILSGSHAGQDQLERFRAEAEAVAHLQHPNIVQIYDVGERDGLPFFSLEFVDGQSLDQMIARQPQAPRRAAEIVEQLARAMDYAHTQGIVHRDLKPANILLTLDGIPKVTDFGLVKRLESDSSQTRTGTIMGTPSYMAPEQARGERDIGPPADTYALGSILYTMLTGRPPFMGPTPVDTVMLVINTEPVPPSRLQPKLPRDIEIICIKCLQKEPEKRYASAEELADDLRRFQRGEPIRARPVGVAERAWRWCRRNPRVAALATAASGLGLVLMVGGPTAAVLVNEQRKEAVAARADAETNAAEARRAQGEAEVAKGVAEQAKVKAEEAQKIADTNAEIANTQRQLALGTLDQVVTQVEEKLRDRSELNDLRQNVLKLAMDGLDNVSRTSDNASHADRMIGAAYQRMGDLLVRAGDVEKAREQFAKALAIFEKLLDAPEGDLVRWNAALTHDGLGDVARKLLEDESVARNHYEKALAYRLELETMATSPKLKPFMVQASLANSSGRISVLLLDAVGDPHEAAVYSQQAIARSEALLQQDPEQKYYQQALAGAWNLHAESLLRINRLEEAESFAQQALAIHQELQQKEPESVKARQDLAITHWRLSEIAFAAGDAAKALELNEAAHAMRLELLRRDPDNPEMHEDLGNSFYRLGLSQLALGREAEAAESFQQCRTHREQALAADPNNRSKQLLLLQAQARSGDVTEVLARADELRATLYPNPGTLVKLAGIYSTCNRTAGEVAGAARQTAVELVKQALDGGYRDMFTLATHPDLEGARSDPQFAPLLTAN